MLQLNTSPAVLEVLGAPVAGSDVRASVMTGAGPCLGGPDMHLVCPSSRSC